MKKLKVLIACEESQTVCKEFRKLGHEAYSCDLQECSGGHTEWHIKCDVLEQLDKGWDLMIGHPPCTFIANSGVKHLYLQNFLPTKIRNSMRWEDLCKAKSFFNALKWSSIKYIALENPIPHKYAVKNSAPGIGFGSCIGIGKYDQIVQPWHFGHKEIKATCFWLKGLPKLRYTNIVGPPPKDKEEKKKWAKVHRMPPGPDRSKQRSKTYEGIAKAMAEQWSEYILINLKQ